MNWSDISYEILLSVIDHCERNEKVQFNRLYGLGVLHQVIERTRSMDEEYCFSSVLLSTIARDLGINVSPFKILGKETDSELEKLAKAYVAQLSNEIRKTIIIRQSGGYDLISL